MTVQRFTARAMPVAALALELLCAAPAARAATGSSGKNSGIFAAENTPLHVTGTATKTHAGSSVGSGLLRTVVALVVVIAVIYGVTWALRRMRRSHEAKASGSGLASVATLPLGGGRSLHLVRAGADLILVGASEHGVTAIRSYNETDARANGLLADGPKVDLEGLLPGGAVEWRPAPDWHERPSHSAHPPGTIGYAIERLRRLTVRP